MTISKDGAIIFDGDDTLWRTQELYDSAKAQFERLMRKEGISEDNIIELFDELDAKRVEIAKFSKTRFLESMLISYAIHCGKHNKTWDVGIESKIRELGFSVFAPPVLYDDAIPTLEMLSEHFHLILFTNGDEAIQKEKIDSLGEKFKSYFFKIYVSEMKSVQEFTKIADELGIPRKKIWVVGNSVRSDINPSLKLGLNAILVLRRTWKYEECTILSDDVITVPSLREAAKSIVERKQG